MRGKTRSIIRGGLAVAVAAVASAMFLSGPANASKAGNTSAMMMNKASSVHVGNPLSKGTSNPL